MKRLPSKSESTVLIFTMFTMGMSAFGVLQSDETFARAIFVIMLLIGALYFAMTYFGLLADDE